MLFGYGLDLSRCIGCRRCEYACVDENNQSKDPQIHWITVLRFKKGEKWVDLEESEKYYNPALGTGSGLFLHAGPVPAVREPSLREGLPDTGDLEGTGRYRGDRLQLVYRLPLLHGRLSLRRAAVQLGGAETENRRNST